MSDMPQMPDMTQEEIKREYEKALKAAQETMAKMTPEERARAEELAKKEQERSRNEIRDIMDRANAILEEKKGDGSRPAPNFCPDCGFPVSGGSFCANCGRPLC